MSGVNGETIVGKPFVITTNNRGLSPEETATLCANKLIGIGENVPEPIRQQAQAYKAEIEKLIAHYMREAIAADRRTLDAKLRMAGRSDTADLLKEF